MFDRFHDLGSELQGVILGGFIGIFSTIVATILSNKNQRKREKYFKLQQVAEEVIIYIRKWQDVDLKIEIDEQQNSKLLDLKQEYHDLIFSKIQVYFSDVGLSHIRDFSVQISHKIAEIYLEKDIDKKTKLKDDLNHIDLVKFKNLLILAVNRYGRNWYQNLIYKCTHKYDNV